MVEHEENIGPTQEEIARAKQEAKSVKGARRRIMSKIAGGVAAAMIGLAGCTPEELQLPKTVSTETPEPSPTPDLTVTPTEKVEPTETPEPTEAPELTPTPEPTLTPEPTEEVEQGIELGPAVQVTEDFQGQVVGKFRNTKTLQERSLSTADGLIWEELAPQSDQLSIIGETTGASILKLPILVDGELMGWLVQPAIQIRVKTETDQALSLWFRIEVDGYASKSSGEIDEWLDVLTIENLDQLMEDGVLTSSELGGSHSGSKSIEDIFSRIGVNFPDDYEYGQFVSVQPDPIVVNMVCGRFTPLRESATADKIKASGGVIEYIRSEDYTQMWRTRMAMVIGSAQWTKPYEGKEDEYKRRIVIGKDPFIFNDTDLYRQILEGEVPVSSLSGEMPLFFGTALKVIKK